MDGLADRSKSLRAAYLAGFWKLGACTTIRRRRCALLVPGGLPVITRVAGDALTVLHNVVTEWACLL
ncbi:MAG: hypothetical protein ACRDSR_28055 [Pseudonocardiaceae bacterium]